MPFFTDRRKPSMPTGINDLNKARSDSMMSMPEAQRRSLERMGRGTSFSDPKPPAAGQSMSASNKRYSASQKTARSPKRMQRGK